MDVFYHGSKFDHICDDINVKETAVLIMIMKFAFAANISLWFQNFSCEATTSSESHIWYLCVHGMFWCTVSE